MRLDDQRAWFRRHPPGDVLMLRQGGFWELVLPSPSRGGTQHPVGLETWPRRFPSHLLEEVETSAAELRLATRLDRRDRPAGGRDR